MDAPPPYSPNSPITWGIDINVTNAGNMAARRLTIRYACPDTPFSEDVTDTFRLATQWEAAQIGNAKKSLDAFWIL